MSNKENSKSCLVVGAGIAGLIAARALHVKGLNVTVLDKGRGVGGRMATRRIGSAVFDHGAQFFTARDPQFCAQVNTLLAADVAKEWCRGFADPEGLTHTDGHPRYRGATGMTAVPKFLAQGLEVRLSQRVVSIEVQAGKWSVSTNLGERFTADALVLTAPVPQSLAMLDAGGTALPSEARTELDAVCYDPCIALMVQPAESVLPAPGGMQLTGEPISWIGDNRQKGISPSAAVTVHAGAVFSRDRWGADDAEITSTLLSAASAWITGSSADIQIHRWRFAKPVALYPDPCLALAEPLPLAFAGDGFGAPRVEGAALSGLAAAQAIISLLEDGHNR